MQEAEEADKNAETIRDIGTKEVRIDKIFLEKKISSFLSKKIFLSVKKADAFAAARKAAH